MISHPHAFLAAVVALTMGLLTLLCHVAKHFGLVDQPSGRHAHDTATPLTGGLAIFGTFGGLALCQAAIPPLLPTMLGVVFVIGLIDDLCRLSARTRLAGELVTALLLIYAAGVQIDDLGNLLGFGTVHLAVLAAPFTALCVVGLINAINMADGVDGLAGGLTLTAMGWLLVAAWLADAPMPPGLLLLAATIVGFLVFNARHPMNRRALAFLGDSGSMVLGLSLAWYAITLSQGPQRMLSPASVLWILGLPVIDTLRVMIQRPLRWRRSPFSGARDHLHHILRAFGLTPGQTSWLLIAVSTLFGAIGVLAPRYGVAEPILTYAFLVVAVAFWVFTPSSPYIAPCGEEVRAFCDRMHCPGARMTAPCSSSAVPRCCGMATDLPASR